MEVVPHRQAEERAGLHGNLVSDTERIFFFFLPLNINCMIHKNSYNHYFSVCIIYQSANSLVN